jgi:sporulation protein YlmC with PRC-barrel domain
MEHHMESEDNELDPHKTSTEQAPEVQPVEESIEPTVVLRDFSEWHGKDLIDSEGERIGKLEDVYFDVETDQPQFATVKEGLFGRHLTFVPLTEMVLGPNDLQVSVSKSLVKNAPNIELQGEALSQQDESTLFHYYQLNYTPSDTPSGRRLARR